MSEKKVWRYGDRGPQAELIQLALQRAELLPEDPDGIYGKRTENAVRAFQKRSGLETDGIVGRKTWKKLEPYLLGYEKVTVQRGDTFYRLAMRYGTTVRAIELANPGVDPLNLSIGSELILPGSFPVVSGKISCTSLAISYFAEGIMARYPFLRKSIIGSSVMENPLICFQIGTGKNRVFFNGTHHANEWIVTPVLLKFLEECAYALGFRKALYGKHAEKIFSETTLTLVPMVNPDGADLVTGELTEGMFYSRAKSFSARYPDIPFPDGWKANLSGVDLNLQYPAGWEKAREIKFAQGYTSPAPRDYVGSMPLTAPESRAVYDLSEKENFDLTVSYHTQGEIIYWKYADYLPPRSEEIGQIFSRESGYVLELTPSASGYAGYKDWFISQYNRPGYTVEAGLGTSPLPVRDFDSIYAKNVGLLLAALTVTA